ncbi:unnamed protein product [Leuciscus chuanchicus]
MKRAFKVRMPEVEQPEGDSSDDLDDETMWEDAEDVEPWSSSGERLSCFAHSLQLVINDGMKELNDLCALLEPFSEATDLTEGDTVFTISMVVPTVLDLRTHLIKMELHLPQIVTIVRAMKKSLEKRFSGIFRRISMDEGDPEQPFNHRIYFLAAMLDPQFGLGWADLDVQNGETGPTLKRFRDDLKKSLTDLLSTEVDRDATAAPIAEDTEESHSDSPPPLKHQRLLSRYKAFKLQRSTTQNSSINAQISKYLESINDRVLSVPASGRH